MDANKWHLKREAEWMKEKELLLTKIKNLQDKLKRKADISSPIDEMKENETEYKTRKIKQVEELNKKIEEQNNLNEELQMINSKLEEDLSDLRSTKREIQSSVEIKTHENAKLHRRVDQMQKVNGQYEIRFQELAKQYEILQSKHKDLRSLVEIEKRKNIDVSNEIKKVKDNEAENMRGKVKDMKELNQKLEERNKYIKELQAINDKLEGELAKVRSMKREFHSRVEIEKQEKAKLFQQIDETQKKSQQYEGSFNELKKQYGSLKSEHEELLSSVKNDERKNIGLYNQVNDMKEKMEKELNEKFEEKNKMYEKFQMTNGELERELRELRSIKKELESKLEYEKMKNAMLCEEIDEAHEKNKHFENSFKKQSEQRETLEFRNKELQRVAEAEKRKNTELGNTIDEMKERKPNHSSAGTGYQDDVENKVLTNNITESSDTKSMVTNITGAREKKPDGELSGREPRIAPKNMTVRLAGTQGSTRAKLKVDDSVINVASDVRSLSTTTNWLVACYEDGNPALSSLVCLGSGSNGIGGFLSLLRDDMVGYVFCRVKDAAHKMATAKFVYIQWVGENVKPIHKAIVINHKYDLEDIFYPAYVTIDARSADDVREDEIMNKVEAVRGSYGNMRI